MKGRNLFGHYTFARTELSELDLVIAAKVLWSFSDEMAILNLKFQLESTSVNRGIPVLLSLLCRQDLGATVYLASSVSMDACASAALTS